MSGERELSDPLQEAMTLLQLWLHVENPEDYEHARSKTMQFTLDYLVDTSHGSADRALRCPPIDWSWIRSVLAQGASIQQDYQAGKYPTYEHYAARLDEAARERVESLATAPQPTLALSAGA